MNDDFIEQVQRAAAGDAAAFGVLYEQVYTDLYRYALYALGSREEAEDAVQETALEAFRGLHGLRQPDAFRGWMFTILSARCNRHIRGLIRRREETDLDACPLACPDFAGDRDTALRLRAAIADLGPEDRRLVLLSVVGGYSGKEIAALLGRPEDSALPPAPDAEKAAGPSAGGRARQHPLTVSATQQLGDTPERHGCL